MSHGRDPSTIPIRAASANTSPAFEYLSTKKDELVGWARKFSLFPYPFVTACCAMEFMAVSSTPYDTDRFGAALPRFSPRQSDLLMVVGTRDAQAGAGPAQGLRADVRAEVGDGVRRLRDQRRLLPELRRASPGIDKIIPVDIYVPGLPAAARDGDRRHHAAAGQDRALAASDPHRGRSDRWPRPSLDQAAAGSSCRAGGAYASSHGMLVLALAPADLLGRACAC